MIIDIKTAEYVDEYKLRIMFSDDNERIVDFEPFLHSNSKYELSELTLGV